MDEPDQRINQAENHGGKHHEHPAAVTVASLIPQRPDLDPGRHRPGIFGHLARVRAEKTLGQR